MVDTPRASCDPEQARRHFRLTRAKPAEDLAHLIDRHWMVEWDLDEPFTQEIVTHPSVNIAFQDPPTIHGVFTGRFRQELTGSGRVIATKFRPGGFHAFHPVPAHHADRPGHPGRHRLRPPPADDVRGDRSTA